MPKPKAILQEAIQDSGNGWWMKGSGGSQFKCARMAYRLRDLRQNVECSMDGMIDGMFDGMFDGEFATAFNLQV